LFLSYFRVILGI